MELPIPTSPTAVQKIWGRDTMSVGMRKVSRKSLPTKTKTSKLWQTRSIRSRKRSTTCTDIATAVSHGLIFSCQSKPFDPFIKAPMLARTVSSKANSSSQTTCRPISNKPSSSPTAANIPSSHATAPSRATRAWTTASPNRAASP